MGERSIGVALAVSVVALFAAPAAQADPAMGQTCIHADFDRTTALADGTVLRCELGEGGGYAWGSSTSKPPNMAHALAEVIGL